VLEHVLQVKDGQQAASRMCNRQPLRTLPKKWRSEREKEWEERDNSIIELVIHPG
jgi:hypothetical protein